MHVYLISIPKERAIQMITICSLEIPMTASFLKALLLFLFYIDMEKKRIVSAQKNKGGHANDGKVAIIQSASGHQSLKVDSLFRFGSWKHFVALIAIL